MSSSSYGFHCINVITTHCLPLYLLMAEYIPRTYAAFELMMAKSCSKIYSVAMACTKIYMGTRVTAKVFLLFHTILFSYFSCHYSLVTINIILVSNNMYLIEQFSLLTLFVVINSYIDVNCLILLYKYIIILVSLCYDFCAICTY